MKNVFIAGFITVTWEKQSQHVRNFFKIMKIRYPESAQIRDKRIKQAKSLVLLRGLCLSAESAARFQPIAAMPQPNMNAIWSAVAMLQPFFREAMLPGPAAWLLANKAQAWLAHSKKIFPQTVPKPDIMQPSVKFWGHNTQLALFVN